MKHIILIGFMGAGKTSVGRFLAKKAGLRFVDTDRLIEEGQQMSINDIFAKHGEAYFRDLETGTLRSLKEETRRLVIAAGGGLPMRQENQRLIRELGTAVYLKADVETLVQRLKGDGSRPKLQGGSLREKIEELMRQREDTYRKVAQLEIDTAGKRPEKIAEEIQAYV